MSKEGNDDKRYKEAEQLGQTNKRLLSSVQGWCQHIEVKGRHASMMGQMLNIPMSTSIGCPHTDGGYQAANLEWIARDFIIENCLTCSKHKPINADNYGVKVVADYHSYQSKVEAEQRERADRLSTLHTEVETLIKNERSKIEVKKLSILKLVEKLDLPDVAHETAVQIAEAAKLSPEFFSEAAINYISLFIDHKDNGAVLMETIANLQISGIKLSSFVLNNVNSAIENDSSTDIAASIWAAEIADSELPKHSEFLEKVIKNCSYQNFYHFGQDKAGSYPESIKILKRLYKADLELFNKLVNDRLIVDEKASRININGLLQDLIEDKSVDIIVHLPLLIRSLDFGDDTDGGESADHETIRSIIALYRVSPVKVMEVAEVAGKRLSEWGQIELIRFYRDVLTEDDLFSINNEMSMLALSRLNAYLMSGPHQDKLVESAMDALEQVARERPDLLLGYLDAYIGFLIQINERRIKFEWYRNDASDTTKPAATFNPLVGKNYWEIESEATDIARLFHSSGDIISKLIAIRPDGSTDKLVEVIAKIDSKIDGKFKGQLIGVLQTSTKDIVSLSKILPQIYNYLHDMDSEDVRFAGMKFVIYLISQFPQLITITLIDLIKVFLDDNLVGIRGLAIEAYGEIVQQFPEHADKVIFKRIQDLIIDKYVFIHKAAVSFSYKIYPFLTKPERALWNIELYRLADFYVRSDDVKYGLEISRAVFYFTADEPVAQEKLVNNLLIRICNCKEYYTEKDAIKLLTSLTRKNPALSNTWVKEAVSFLSRTLPQEPLGNNDDRMQILDFFYQLDEATIVKNQDLISAHVMAVIDKLVNPIMPDVVQFHAVFAYFNQWRSIVELTTYFDGKIPHGSKFEHVHRFNQRSRRIADKEIRVSDGSIDLAYLQSY